MERMPAALDDATKTLRVLLLEDSALDAELIILELRGFGYEPDWTRVDTEEDFRTHIDSELDLVLADFTLPQFDALSALKILRGQGLSTPFIIVTGSITEETAVSILKHGADDFLLKDRLTRLGPAVNNAMRQRRLRDERRRAQQRLIEHEERYRRLITRMSALVIELDPNGTTLFVNEAVSAVTGFAPDEVLGRNWFELFFSGEPSERPDGAASILSRGEDLRNYVTQCRTKDGSLLSLEWNTANESGVDGRLHKILAFGMDISERERAAIRIRQLSRLNAAIAAANELLVRSQSPAEVYAAVCRACVEHGGFRLAWVGLADFQARRMLVADAFGPARGYLDGISISTEASAATGRGPTGIAFRERRVYICNDIGANPDSAPWQGNAARHGLVASIALPIYQGGKCIGALTVYGGEKDVFVPEAVTLLQRMAENISFAMDQFKREEQRQEAEVTLRISEGRLRQAQAIGRIGDWGLDLETMELRWSPQMFSLYERDPATGTPTLDDILQHYVGESGPPTGENLRRAIATGERVELEQRLRLPSGGDAYHAVVIIPRKNDDGLVTKVFGTVQDISERKKLEEQRQADVLRLAELSRRVVAVQEEERRQLAGELHDRTSPNLAAASLNLGMIAADLPPRIPDGLESRLADTRALLAETMAGIRDVCADLRPATLDYAGLPHALREYAEKVSQRTGIAVKVSGASPAARLNADSESMLFRVAQEALTNCAKHAQASAVNIELSFDNPQTVMTISDDGTGFDPGAIGQTGRRPGLGLLTMRERVEFAGGKFSLESAPGKGTRIRVEIEEPLAK
jgi:PAS domain S-box-containing protein